MFSSRLIALTLVGLAAFSANAASQPRCKVLPGDAKWPSQNEWNALNNTVDGRLIRTVPIGSSCRTSSFNAKACAHVRQGWGDFDLHTESSSSLMQWYYAEKSCDPFSGPDSPCVIGTYVQYAVDVATQAHIIATVKFAKKHNIRFVVRNTGHDYMGKSTGRGALAIWTHHLKKTTWFDDYKSSGYQGPAVKAAAGIQGIEIYKQADAHGYSIVGGDCPTVGYAGGFVGGGGHSPLGGLYGLASDQVLSFEVITTTGKFLTASPTKNADLYWALSGGGPGTFAIVWTVTVKAFRDVPVTSVQLSFNAGDNVSLAAWWTALDFYQSQIPRYTSKGIYSLATIETGTFALRPSYFPNTTTADITTLFQPFFSHLTTAGIPFQSSVTTYPRFLQSFETENVPTEGFMGGVLVGGRLLGDDLWESDERFREMTKTVKSIVEDGVTIIDIVTRPSLEIAGRKAGDNAVLPAWRTNQRLLLLTLTSAANATLAEVNQQRKTITAMGEKLTKLTPNSGSYLNEADVLDPNWKTAFYGENYARLLSIKQKYDPNGILYGSTSVGGDLWKLNREGALCAV